jgi:hypothetical protein
MENGVASSELPDIYCDSVQIAMTPYDTVLMLTKNIPTFGGKAGKIEVTPDPVGTVRMSLEHAKVLAILLKRYLQEYERSTGMQIPLHPEMLKNLGISEDEDW